MTFSIVIPSYNGSKFLERTINSVINQIRKPDEIIVFDDNSSDNTKLICDKYSTKIKYIFNKDGPSGFVNSWNNSIKYTSCEYISILHQDDLLHPDFLLIAEETLNNNKNCKHFFSLCDYVNENDVIIEDSIYSDFFENIDNKVKVFNTKEYISAYQKKYNNTFHIHRCPGVVTHKSIFNDKGCWYNPSAGHIADDDFFYRVSFLTDVVGYLKPLSQYRIHKDQETSSIGDVKLVSRLSDDYLFQIKQWKNNINLEKNHKIYFVTNFLKYNKRLLGYSIYNKDYSLLYKSINNFLIFLKNWF